MAVTTSKTLRNQVLYSVYVRNHTAEGTFEALRRDLGRVKALGADIIWLLPIHPIGAGARKGTLGSPYAISDYRAVNPELGTLEDFRRLVEDIHGLGMKCIIDVVYNHTSPDSWLMRNHPDWFYRGPEGRPGNRFGDWTDVVDLDYAKPALWDYQIETLKYWASMVDGFRCDVAPLVPLEFWLRAREEVEKVRPGCLWLAESVEPSMIRECRAEGISVLSDSECYQAFDICYDYDIFNTFQDYLEGKVPLERYAQAVNAQESIYPGNFVKLRFLENHDRARAAFLIPEGMALASWTAFLYFQKGMTLLYAGQEAECTHRPGLFDKDGVEWRGGEGVTRLLRTLAKLKRNPILADSRYEVKALPGDILYAVHRRGDRQLVGLFSVKGNASPARVEAPDGFYPNLLDENGQEVEVYEGMVSVKGAPIVFEAPWTGDKQS